MTTHNRDEFQPIENPYIVGNPVKEPEMFFGREEDFAFIRQKVAGARKGGLLVLCGARRSGKTSILFQIMNGRLGEGFFPVLIDMQSMAVKNDREFLVKLARRIVDAVGASNISFDRDFLDRDDDNPLDAFQAFVLEVVRRLSGQKLILLFDEYEIFESRIDKGLLSAAILDIFGSWLDHQEDIFIVFTGSDKIDKRKRDYWGRVLPKAVFSKKISFLEKSDAFRLIEEPLKGVIRYEHGIPEKIYEITAGQPFYTQVFCQILVDQLNQHRRYDVRSEYLEDAVDQIVDNPLPQMIFSWNSLTDAERLTLSIIAELHGESVAASRDEDIHRFARKKRIGLRIDGTVLSESLEKLFHQDILEKDPTGKAYTFRLGLWRRWIARMHSVWEVTDEMKDGANELGEGITLSPERRRRGWIITAAALAVVVAVTVILFLRGWGGIDTTVSSLPEVDSTRITIRTNPPDAEIILGKRILGRSPVEELLVPVERTVLGVRLDGYKEFVDTLDLRDPEQTQRAIDLVARVGSLKLTTSPPGGLVYMGKRLHGAKTPTIISSLPISELYDIQVTLTGYEPGKFDNVQIFEDSIVSKHHEFDLLEYQLQITSTPELADIYIDDQFAGKTPDVAVLSHGIHKIEIKKGGYEPVELSRRVTQNGSYIDVKLKKLAPGVLVIMVRPWADIYIDGELVERERTNLRVTLEPGRYRVRLTNPHYEAKEAEIEVKSKTQEVFEWDLRAKERQ